MGKIAHVLHTRAARLSLVGKVRKFWRAPRPLKSLLLRLPFMIGGVRLGLSAFPFQRVLGVVEKEAQKPVASALSLEDITWAVNAVGRRLLPSRPCLPLALVTLLLLRRRGHRATLRLGVAKDEEEEEMRAHAWVESEGGAVVMGHLHDLSTYAPFPDVK